MSLMERPQRYEQVHGSVSRYRAGCDCEQCAMVPMKRAERKRLESIKGIPYDQLHICNLCGRYFTTKGGATLHEARCEW